MAIGRLDNRAALPAHSPLLLSKGTRLMRDLLFPTTVLLLLLLAPAANAQRVPGPPAANDAPKPKPTPKSLGLPDATSPLIGFFQGFDQKEKKVKLAFIDTMPEVVEKVVKKNGVEETV